MKQTKRIAVLIFALALLVLGIIGLVLPFLQGFLFIAVALILLSMLSPTVREKIEFQTRKYPKFHGLVVKAESWVQKVVGDL